MRLAKRIFVLITASMLPLAACGGEDGGTEVCTDPTGSDYSYVVKSLQLPNNAAEASQLAFDLDGSLPTRNDNELGKNLAALAGVAGLNLTTAVGDAVSSGDVILLVNLRTEDLQSSACAGVSVYLGENPSVAPCETPEDTVCGRHLDGTASFDIAAGSPTDTTLNGAILGGTFQLGANDSPGNFAIELNLVEGADPITLDLIGARVKVSGITEGGLETGLLGGAITKTALETSVLPAITALVDGIVQTDCGGTAPDCCTPGTNGALVIGYFDTDDSCDVTLEELKANAFVAAMLTPDLDLLDAAGNYNPNSDGELESMSLGLGFSAVKGTFTVPQ